MGSFQTFIRENEVLRELWREELAEGEARAEAKGKAEGLQSALRGILRSKFGRVPKWANDRLKKAENSQIERWLSKVIMAQSLEVVVGKK